MTGPLEYANLASVASADTVDLDAATSNLVEITGTTTITGITLADGATRLVRFAGALTLTNGASLILPGGANITTAAGDWAIIVGKASGVVEVILYGRQGEITADQLSPAQFGGDYVKLSEVQTSGTDGGASVAGTQTRVLNTEDVDTGDICALSSNQFTLPAGTYQIRARAPCYVGDEHQLSLRNVTDSTTPLVGQSAYANSANAVYGHAELEGQFTISGTKTFDLRHYITTAKTTNGLGRAVSSGLSEVFAVVELWRVK
jgi:hypothetical protein